MRQKKITLYLTVADANGICASQTTAAAADLVINGALKIADTSLATFGTAAAVRITSDGDESSATFTVNGTDANGNAITEGVTGPAATTADSNLSFLTVTSVFIDIAGVGNIEVGNAADDNGICVSQTKTLAGALNMNGAMAVVANMYGLATLSPAAAVKIASAGNDTGITFTVYGRDADDVEMSEVITGVSGATATGSKLFTKVMAVYASADTASTVTVGHAADADGICLSQDPGAAAYLIFNGAGCELAARHVSIYSSGDESGITFTVAGTDRRDLPLTEVITGPNTTTVKGKKNFATVRSVRASGAVTGNAIVGSADECESQVVPVNYFDTSVTLQVHRSSDASFKNRSGATVSNLLGGDENEDTADYVYQYGWVSEDELYASSGAITGLRLGLQTHVRGSADFMILSPTQSRN